MRGKAWIVQEPQICFGYATIRGTRIFPATLYDRWRAGESLRFLASDYDLPIGAARAAIRFCWPGPTGEIQRRARFEEAAK